MNSWKARVQEYNEENNIVTSPFQTGGDSNNGQTSLDIPKIDDPYYNQITINGKLYSLKNRNTVQLIKKIIAHYDENELE
jgi:hypothetical protein